MTSLKTSGSDLSLYCRQKVFLVEDDRLVTSETFSKLSIGCYRMLRTGFPWRALPEKYGSWKTVYSRFRRRQKREYLRAVLELLTLQADMNHIMIDGPYVHAHKHSAGARHTTGHNQALGRSRGGFTSKIHAVVDALGHLTAFTVTAGQSSEYPQAGNHLIQYHDTTIPADKGMTAGASSRRFTSREVKRLFPPEGRIIIPVPSTDITARNAILLRLFNKIKEYRKIATRHDKPADVFAAFVCLAASLIRLR